MKALFALLRTSLMTALQYRGDLVFQLLTGVIRTASALAPLWLVFQHTERVGGWTAGESTAVMGFFLLLQAFQGGMLEPNLGEVVEAIRKGTLDLWLLKPADSQLIVSLRKIDPAYAWDTVAGLSVVGFALSRMDVVRPIDLMVAVWLFFCGLMSIYGLWLFATCTSFFWVRVDNLRYLLISFADAGRWPIHVFSGWIRILLTVVVPVAVVTSFPATALRGDWGIGLGLAGTSIAALFLAVSRWAWLRSLARYTSASS